jgi:hypothetical protein
MIGYWARINLSSLEKVDNIYKSAHVQPSLPPSIDRILPVLTDSHTTMSNSDDLKTIQPSTIYLRSDDAPETEIPIEVEITKTLRRTLSVVAHFKPTTDSKVLTLGTTYVVKSYDYDQMFFQDESPTDPELWADESFIKEKCAYDILRKFQGNTISRCYGTAWWLRPDQRKVNALILEYVEGCTIQDLSIEEKKTIGKVVADNARAALRPPKGLGILHGDVRPANFIVRSDLSVIMLDLGSCTLDVTEKEWEEKYQDEDMEILDFELHRNEVDIYPPEDPKRFRDQYRGYLLWNRHVQTQPATWREKYYRYVEGKGPYELRWDLKEDVPRDILADKGFY